MMVAVTNLGVFSYIVKKDSFDWDAAVNHSHEAVGMEREASTLKGLQEAAEYYVSSDGCGGWRR